MGGSSLRAVVVLGFAAAVAAVVVGHDIAALRVDAGRTQENLLVEHNEDQPLGEANDNESREDRARAHDRPSLAEPGESSCE